MQVLATPFHRKASDGSISEDGTAANKSAGIYIVCDGVSGPYSPSNPLIKYPGNITGGQMVSQTICNHILSASHNHGIRNILVDTNTDVLINHCNMGKDLAKEAVAGAALAACQIGKEWVKFIVAGDCFVLYRYSDSFHFFTNLDQAAFGFEQQGNDAFEACKDQTDGNIAQAWDLYFPYFAKKQFDCANRNLGKGGRSILNGNPDFEKCWTERLVSLSGLEWILLGTDGLLTAASSNPANWEKVAKEVGQIYAARGLPALIDWRDQRDFLPHISGHPEASAIEIIFN